MKEAILYYENPEACDLPQAVWLRSPDEPVPSIFDDGADYLLDADRLIRSKEDAKRFVEAEFLPGSCNLIDAICIGHGTGF